MRHHYADLIGCLCIIDRSKPGLWLSRTTGEFAAMTLAERKVALEIARDSWPGIILNNISTCCLADCMQLLDHSIERVPTQEVSHLSVTKKIPGTGGCSFLSVPGCQGAEGMHTSQPSCLVCWLPLAV